MISFIKGGSVKKTILILVLLAYMFVFWQWHKDQGKPSTYFGELSGATEVKEFTDSDSKTLSYWVQMDYPAKPAVDFYDKTLRSKGWTQMGTKGLPGQREWLASKHAGDSAGQTICSYDYKTGWLNPQKKDRLMELKLLYFLVSPSGKCPPKPNNNILFITIQETPFTGT